MALFSDYDAAPPRWRTGSIVGWSLLGFALLGIGVVALVPAPYVIEQPGPVYDTLGEVSFGEERVPLIDIPDERTYPTAGSLDMLTVTISGNREELPSWLDLATAYFDPSKAIIPVDEVYPPGVTREQSTEQGRIDMENSQKEAIAAALTQLGHEFPSTVTVVDVQDDVPAAGVLEAADIILSVNGDPVADVTGLRAEIAENGIERAAEVVIVRDGVERTVEITPALSPQDGTTPVIGVIVGGDYQFPFEVNIQLENVGGPSAGMMFALGIIDKLTPGELNGGENVAGTGTITGAGQVGAIGGIRQKMWGALRAGAEWFLAPESNCGEVVGQVPDGLTVFSVATLDDALAALEAIAGDGDTAALPTCTTG